MCKGCNYGEYEEVYVKVLASHSCVGKDVWVIKKIDKCIAQIVKALQNADIDMLGSCCGHGKKDGVIL
ncbi:MAG: hypothetical protein ACOCUI_04930 [bacterium]